MSADTALARLLHSEGALDTETLRRLLEGVRAQRAGGGPGASLAQVLGERGLVPRATLSRALSALESSAQAPPRADLPPDLGPYRVVRELARGGMGAVYELEHEGGGRFALKTLLPGALLGNSDEERERFRREGEALARLNHPHVVRIHAAEFHARVPYMIQDFLPGGTLDERLAKGPLAPEEAVELCAKLAQGLAHAHGCGLLHRDLKPLNVLFDDRGEPRLVDFGLVRSLHGSSLTQTGQVLGTPSYMAPEQILGEPVDERTDVYGLGGVLYALLSGGPPFRGEGLAILASVVNDPPRAPRELNPATPPWLSEICLRALAKDPGERFPSAEAFAAALAARSAGAGRPRRGRLLALLLLACVLLGAGLWVGTRGQADPPLADAMAPRLTEGASFAELRAQVPGWESRAPTPSTSLILLRALLAADAGERSRFAEQVALLPPDALSPAAERVLLAARTLLDPAASDVRPAIRALEEAPGAGLEIVDLRGWEARLRSRRGSGVDTRALLAALGEVARRRGPLNAAEVGALERALEEGPAPPLARLEQEWLARLPCGRRARLALSLAQRVGEIDPRELLEGLERIGSAPRFLLQAVRAQAKARLAAASRQIPTSSTALPSAADYERWTAWLRVAQRLDLRKQARAFLAQAGKHALVLYPHVSTHTNAANQIDRMNREVQTHAQIMQGLFLTAVAEAAPPAQSGAYWAQLVQCAMLSIDEAQGGYVAGLERLAERIEDPGERAWARVFAAHSLLRVTRTNWRALPEEAFLSCVLFTLRKVEDLDLGKLPGLPPQDSRLAGVASKHQHAGAVAAAIRGWCELTLCRVADAARTFTFVSTLPVGADAGVEVWASWWIQARYFVLAALPEAERVPLQRALASDCLQRMRHERLRSGRLLSFAWLLRGVMTPPQRRQVLDDLSQGSVGDFNRAEWRLRQVVLALEEGELASALENLRAASRSLRTKERGPELAKVVDAFAAKLRPPSATPAQIEEAEALFHRVYRETR